MRGGARHRRAAGKAAALLFSAVETLLALGVIEQPDERRIFFFNGRRESAVALGVVEQPGERRLLFFRVAESAVAHGIVEQ